MSRRIIGLTGGIACGKSTVSNYLENIYKIPVLDADIYAREAVETTVTILKDGPISPESSSRQRTIIFVSLGAVRNKNSDRDIKSSRYR